MYQDIINQIESGSADIPLYVEQDFQQTYDAMPAFGSMIDLMGIHREEKTIDVKLKKFLVIIDGELNELQSGSPPGLDPIHEGAGILQVR